jgi:3'(2'), 5'-bisphosphate nucleotidase
MNELAPSLLVTNLLTLAQAAGREIMRIYKEGCIVQTKLDNTPVTEADANAEAIILAGLKGIYPNIPVIAEESAAAGRIPEFENEFFLVDPLDGTKEFISRNGEFTVNIALVQKGRPVAGVVYAPAINAIYWGEIGVGSAKATLSPEQDMLSASWHALKVRELPSSGATVLASRSHRDPATDSYLSTIKIHKLVGAGSSLKFCTIAEGEADLYPRFGRTMEWDTAAGHAVLAAAGGTVNQAEDGTPLRYGKRERGFDNPSFIASA